MLEAIIALSLQIAVNRQTSILTGQTPGEYYEITNVTCDPVTKATYSVGVRYTVDWNGSGDKWIMHTQPRNIFGTKCVDKKFIANTIVADPNIKVLGR